MCYGAVCCVGVFFFFKQKTAYEMRISDWSSDVCSSDLLSGGDDGRLVRTAADGTADELASVPRKWIEHVVVADHGNALNSQIAYAAGRRVDLLPSDAEIAARWKAYTPPKLEHPTPWQEI